LLNTRQRRLLIERGLVVEHTLGEIHPAERV
jgi:hypothetical protein